MALTLSVASFFWSQICLSSPGSQCRSPAQSFFLAPPQSNNRVRVCKFAQKSEFRTLPYGEQCRRLRGISGLRDGGVSGDVGAVNGEESSVARAQISETASVESRNQEFSSVEDIKAALISSLEGMNPFAKFRTHLMQDLTFADLVSLICYVGAVYSLSNPYLEVEYSEECVGLQPCRTQKNLLCPLLDLVFAQLVI